MFFVGKIGESWPSCLVFFLEGGRNAMVRRGEKRDSVRYALLLLRLKQGAKVKFLPVPPAHNHFPYFHDVEILLPRLRAREDRRKGFCSPFRAVSIFSFWCQWDDRVSLRSEDDGQVEKGSWVRARHTHLPERRDAHHNGYDALPCPSSRMWAHVCERVGVCFSLYLMVKMGGLAKNV